MEWSIFIRLEFYNSGLFREESCFFTVGAVVLTEQHLFQVLTNKNFYYHDSMHQTS